MLPDHVHDMLRSLLVSRFDRLDSVADSGIVNEEWLQVQNSREGRDATRVINASGESGTHRGQGGAECMESYSMKSVNTDTLRDSVKREHAPMNNRQGQRRRARDSDLPGTVTS